MDDRYPVVLGYPDAEQKDGITTIRLTGLMTQEHYRLWSVLLETQARADAHEHAAHKANRTIPPIGAYCLTDVVVMQRTGEHESIKTTAACSLRTINDLIDFLTHWSAVEDELEAEQDGAM